MRTSVLHAIFISCTLPILNGQTIKPDTLPLYLDMPEIVVCQKRDGLFAQTPGSVCYISPDQIYKIQPVSGNDVLRSIPGVQVTDEEGAGLRLNLGIRGLDPDRSRGLLVLEDGVPIALSPYGEPELYYTPTIERMEGVELVKGSAQIAHGPQTIGGVLNYITAAPPRSPQGRMRLNFGQGGLYHQYLGYGDSVGKAGYQINYLFKRADKVVYAGYRVHDVNARWTYAVSPKSNIGIKVSFYDEWSDATYIGLTQTMYDRGGQDFVQMAPDDQLMIRRYAASATHLWQPDSRQTLKTTVFAFTTSRDWRRQDFTSTPGHPRQTSLIWGDTTINEGAVYMLGTASHRNRQFEVAGIDFRYAKQYSIGRHDFEWESGARFLYEKADEQRINSTQSDGMSGQLVEDEDRPGKAWSGFVQHHAHLWNHWHFTAGVRLEHYGYERMIYRNRYNNVVTDTLIRAGETVNAWIPGIGLNFSLNSEWTIFAGIHRGFAPPRIKDAITKAGEAMQLNAETSWNGELGIRKHLKGVWGAEVTLFYMTFENQIIPVSESSGGTGSGLTNGGETIHQGAEGAVWVHLGNWLGKNHDLDLNGSMTWVDARYSSDRFIRRGQETININGNRTPYAPRLNSQIRMYYCWKKMIGIQLTGTFVGEQFADELNSILPAANGRTGKIDAYQLIDGSIFYTLHNTPLRISITGKNLINERYITSRRPQGIRVGMPRFLMGAISFDF